MLSARGRRRRQVLAFLLRTMLMAALTLVAGQVVAPSAASAAAGDVGTEGSSTSGTTTPTGGKRAESVLWFNDGIWWADMWDAGQQRFCIFRLNESTQTWVNTGTEIERRANTHADALWDGTKLFIATHRILDDGAPAEPNYPSHLYRYSYDSSTKQYRLDAGFPNVVNNYRTETLTIDKDSTGRLWATWQQANRIYVNRTSLDQQTWGTPFVLPGSPAVTVDDTSALIAFGGNRIGVLHSRQTGGASDGMYWSVHRDQDPDTTWAASVAAVTGSGSGDDHMNLKWLDASGGQVYAAVKTEYSASASDLIQLLVLDTTTGVWRPPYRIASVSDCPNRVIVLLDEDSGLIRTFATYPAPGGSCSSSGGAIYEKTSPMGAISFPVGKGTPRIVDADSPYMHNVSSTKQNINSRAANGARGVLVLAHNARTARYWHHHQAATDPVGPSASFGASPSSGAPPLEVAFTDTSSGSPTTWQWDFGDGTTSTAQHPTKTYTAVGEYQVTLTVSNAVGSSTASRTVSVAEAPPPPAASFTASAPSGRAPHSVTFTDTTTGSPSIWQWDFGDGTTSTVQHPSKTYSAPGTYRVTLTAGNASGASSAWQDVVVVPALSVVITEGPPTSTTSRTATFTFSLSEPGSAQCRVDAQPFRPCTSPVSYTDLVKGKHVFHVQATATSDGAAASTSWTWNVRR